MKRIWTQGEERGFSEFKKEFFYDGKGKNALLKIGADYKYAAYLNGAFVANAQYADIPEKKRVDEIDLAPFLKSGNNELYVVAAHMGEDFSVARTMAAFISFEVMIDGVSIACSDENTWGRAAAKYSVGDKITPQLGYGWKYDFTALGGDWKPCRAVLDKFTDEKRPIERLRISAPLPWEIVAQGVFKYRVGETAAAKMQNAWMSTLRFAEMTGQDRIKAAGACRPVRFSAKTQGGDGIFLIADLKKETSGYLSLCVRTDRACRGIIGWGEHLADLRVRTEREGRNFACELFFAEGENALDEYLYRVGCRYLCLYIENGSAELVRLSVREALYPFKKIEKEFGDRLLNKIYETGRRTLELCAHEHYEDCPWREQALYGMDSRNQMLFGYGVFEEYEFPRASLRLFADTLRGDGLLQLCAPARANITIPSFSAYWIIAVCENAEADYDEKFVGEMLPKAEKMLGIFRERSSENGVSVFTEACYWNFHEWSDGLDGGNFNRTEEIPKAHDGILTALVSIAADKLAALEKRFGKGAQAAETQKYSASLKDSLNAFYDPEKEMYASYKASDGTLYGYHAYMQAATLLACDLDANRAGRLCAVLKSPKGKAVEMTLAALPMQYDAIVKAEKDCKWCVENVAEIFGKMLYAGATSYWETERGEADFNDAGSLCHGWSAVACYVLDKYLGGAKR